jgi:hypothetical protein
MTGPFDPDYRRPGTRPEDWPADRFRRNGNPVGPADLVFAGGLVAIICIAGLALWFGLRGKWEPPAERIAAPQAADQAIQRGLQFLARHQMPDGRWSLTDFGASRSEIPAAERASLNSDTAATGLAMLCFLRAGYRPQDPEFGPAIRRGLDFLVNNQKADGDLFVLENSESNQCVWLYSHGIATMAICEAYAISQDAALREPAQKAIDFAVSAQHPIRGGWRYSPRYGSDTSVTVWVFAALVRGRQAGLDVPDGAFDHVESWLDKAQASTGEPHRFCYNPYAPDTQAQRHGREPNKAMTAAGLWMRSHLGWQQSGLPMVSGADFLLDHPPEMGSYQRPSRDVYYWYHATHVMCFMQGSHWEVWKRQLHPLLIESQIKQGTLAGSWDPRKPVPDRWGRHGGRMYVTSLSLLMLEVNDRDAAR